MLHSRLLWLKRHEPDVFAKVKHVMLPHDYVNFWLSGRIVAEVGSSHRCRGWSISDSYRCRGWFISDSYCCRGPFITSSCRCRGRFILEVHVQERDKFALNVFVNPTADLSSY